MLPLKSFNFVMEELSHPEHKVPRARAICSAMGLMKVFTVPCLVTFNSALHTKVCEVEQAVITRNALNDEFHGPVALRWSLSIKEYPTCRFGLTSS